MAPVLKSGKGRDASSARPNWATISVSPDQPLAQSQAIQGRSGSIRDPGTARLIVAASLTLRDLLRLRASPG